jgi:hypothetical protein
MAKKSAGGAAITTIEVVAALVSLWLAYRLFFAKKTAANPYASLGGSSSGGYGSSTPYSQASMSSNPLSALMNALQSLLGKSGSSSKGSSGGNSGNGSGANGAASTATNPFATLADFVKAGNNDLANNLDWSGDYTNANSNALDGVGLTESPASYDYLDVSQYAQDFNPFSGVEAPVSDSFDPGSYDPFASGGDYGISYEPLQTYDFSGGSYDFGGGGGGGYDDLDAMDQL